MQSGNREIAFCEFSGIYRGPTLFRARSGCRSSRISAAKAMSSADNFLQKTAKTAGAQGEEWPWWLSRAPGLAAFSAGD
jgi:hypothetical protein